MFNTTSVEHHKLLFLSHPKGLQHTPSGSMGRWLTAVLGHCPPDGGNVLLGTPLQKQLWPLSCGSAAFVSEKSFLSPHSIFRWPPFAGARRWGSVHCRMNASFPPREGELVVPFPAAWEQRKEKIAVWTVFWCGFRSLTQHWKGLTVCQNANVSNWKSS